MDRMELNIDMVYDGGKGGGKSVNLAFSYLGASRYGGVNHGSLLPLDLLLCDDEVCNKTLHIFVR